MTERLWVEFIPSAPGGGRFSAETMESSSSCTCAKIDGVHTPVRIAIASIKRYKFPSQPTNTTGRQSFVVATRQRTTAKKESGYLQRHRVLAEGLRREWLSDPERRDEQPPPPSPSGGRRRRTDTDAAFPRPRARHAARPCPREQPGAARHGRGRGGFHRLQNRRVHGGQSAGAQEREEGRRRRCGWSE